VSNKVVWIINQYASTPDVGMGGRHFYLSRELVKQGLTVYVIASSYTHLHRDPPEVKDKHLEQVIDGVNYIWLKMPKYSDAHSKQRILNWFLFAWKLLALGKIIRDRPDAILFSSPSLVGFLGARALSKRFRCKLAFEVRDIWPLTFIKIGGFSKKHPFIIFMQFIERYAYKRADVVISNLKNAVEHMMLQKMHPAKFSWIPNGVSFNEVQSPDLLPLNVINSIPKDKFIVGYTGTLGVANALEYFVDAADQLKSISDICFVMVGDGKERSTLESQVIDKKLDNVVFIESVKKSQVQSLLKCFDVCYIGWRDEDIYKYGIAPNKLPEYMYAEKPIVHSFSGGGDYVIESGCGLTVPAEDSQAIAIAIKKLYCLKNVDRLEMGRKGHEFVLNNLEYGDLAHKLSEVLLRY
tara:strand:- start:2752 stop:3978 length:1227 start_codon:yes stop_codon:yes gene_type:complete